MLNKRTTLVLGAGASAGYGFPVGDGLRRLILGITAISREAAGVFNTDELRHFQAALDASQWNSVDAFLAHRPELSTIGKRAIAYVLLGFEKTPPRAVPNEKSGPDDWYRYFLNKFSDKPWEGLDFSSLAVVNFNYDRSFECYLLSALCAAYNKKVEEVAKKLEALEIVHVYGSLGGRLASNALKVPYGVPVTRKHVEIAADSLKVIPDHRSADDTDLSKARALLSDAEVICFLGFAFDKTNMRRLDAAKTCAGRSRQNTVCASVYGMTPAEAKDAAQACGLTLHTRQFLETSPYAGYNSISTSSEGYPDGFLPLRCLDTLRSLNIIG